jgi:hypothetical protein
MQYDGVGSESVVVQDFYYNATPKAPPKREYGYTSTRTQVPRLRGVARLLMIQLVPADMTLGIRENDSEFRNPSWFSVNLRTTWYNLLYKG